MLLIQQHKDKPQIFEIAWMWLPTFIGQNTGLLAELDHSLAVRFPPPLEVDNALMKSIHEFIIEWLCQRIKIEGLEDYLRAIGHIKENSDDASI